MAVIEINSIRKIKINLEDYDYRSDLNHRLFLYHLKATDVRLLEEIVYSSIQISISKLITLVQISEKELFDALEKFVTLGLISIRGDIIFVDKQKRKYFEMHLMRFDEDFKPDMHYFQSLLKTLPIHLLPSWYSISKTSDNIFESIVEKYLLTPSIYEHHLEEFLSSDPLLQQIGDDLFSHPQKEIALFPLMQKLRLNSIQLEQIILLLEYTAIAGCVFHKKGPNFEPYLCAFKEWHEYGDFLQKTDPKEIADPKKIDQSYLGDFNFIENMTSCLKCLKEKALPILETSPLSISLEWVQNYLKKSKNLQFSNLEDASDYLKSVFSKLIQIDLATIKDHKIVFSEKASYWLKMSLEDQALYLYRHPLNQQASLDLSLPLKNEKHLREAEKSILRVLNKGWVDYESFLKSVCVPLSEVSIVTLKKQGGSYSYEPVQYTEDEKHLLKKTVLDWLFEVGCVAKGKFQNKDCFRITNFGKKLFER
jgi:hypothetical protein